MALTTIAYFDSQLNEEQLGQSIEAQGLSFTMEPVNETTTYITVKPHKGFGIYLSTREEILDFDEQKFLSKISMSFREDGVGGDFDTKMSAALLVDWLTRKYKISCCLTREGESILVLFDKGESYIIAEDSYDWVERIINIRGSSDTIQMRRFDWL